MGLYPKPKGPAPRGDVQRALQPFVGISALASTALIGLMGALFLVPLWIAERSGWTGALGVAGWGLLALAAPALLAVYAASRKGIRRQLRPLGQVASAIAPPGAPLVVHGRLRRGWGCSVEFDREGARVRVVAARGQRSRPELYLVRGEREYPFRDVREPLPELDDARRAVGL